MRERVAESAGPLRSRSTGYFERFGMLEAENARLRGVVGILALLGAVLGGVLGLSVLRPRPVYYIPGAVASGVALPDQVPLSSVGSFASSWLLDWMNYSPLTVEGVYERAMRSMGPRFFSQVRGRMNEEMDKVRQDSVSSLFTLERAPVATQDGWGKFRVVLQGRRGIYVGKEEMAWRPMRFVVDVVSRPVSPERPFGLEIADVRGEGGDER